MTSLAVLMGAYTLKHVFDALRKLMTPPDPPKRPIGFITPEDEGKKAHARHKT